MTWVEEQWRHILFYSGRFCLLERMELPVIPEYDCFWELIAREVVVALVGVRFDE